MEDADFDSPVDVPQPASGGAGGDLPAASAADLDMLMSLGFTEAQVGKAMRSTGNSVERAAEWLFSHPDEEDTGTAPCVSADVAAEAAAGSEAQADGKYELIGIISHLGRNTDCGHYVCHIKKDGKWVFFNDDKVAASENPPKDCGFMYLFRRFDSDGSGDVF